MLARPRRGVELDVHPGPSLATCCDAPPYVRSGLVVSSPASVRPSSGFALPPVFELNL